MPDVNPSITLNFRKGGIDFSRSFNVSFDVDSALYIASTVSVGTSDAVIDQGDLTQAGLLLLRNLEARSLVVTPVAPTVTPQGTTGAATWSYKIVAKQVDSDGNVVAYSQASSVGTTTTGKATLTGTDFNRITWAEDENANGGYDIYRTAHGTGPTTNGVIGSVAEGVTTFDDTGLAGDSATAPSVPRDNIIDVGENGTSYPVELQGGDIALFRCSSTSSLDIHAKARNNTCEIERILLNA